MCVCVSLSLNEFSNNHCILSDQDASASYDFVWYDNDPTPDENSDEPNSHGTSCAGEVAMGRNCSCGIGVAHGCSIGGNMGLLCRIV